MKVNIRKITQNSLLKEILELRLKGKNGLNNEIYKHIKPGQDVVYVRKMKDLINTYLWVKGG